MDLAGAGVPECFDGRSLLPILRGQQPEDWPDHIVAECAGVHFAYETRMVVWDRFKYVFHPGAFDELYDLREDPHELANLVHSAGHAEILREGRRRLLCRMRQTHDPLHRAFFLFEKRRPWSPETVTPYGPGASRTLADQPPDLTGDDA